MGVVRSQATGPEVGDVLRAIGLTCSCTWQESRWVSCPEHRDAPPDVTGLPDADAWNTLDTWLRETDMPQYLRERVTAQCDVLLDRMREDIAQHQVAAAESRARMTFTDGGPR